MDLETPWQYFRNVGTPGAVPSHPRRIHRTIVDPKETLPEEQDAATTTALTKELSEFLLEFSIGVHRYAMYPPGHPSLLPAAENIIGRLSEIFLDQNTLSIGVASEQLVIDGVATDPKHPVLRDLARRLHGHQIGALSFTKGVVAREVEGVLKTLAQDSEREGDPLGLLSKEEIPSWEHARLYPLGYGGLELKEDGDSETQDLEQSTHLWLGLARAAVASDDPEKVSPSIGAEDVAQAIQSHRREAAYDQVIVGYLLQLAEELKRGEGGEAESIRKRVSSLIRQLDPATLERMVTMGGSVDQRRRFVLDSNQSLAVDSVVKILQAAASASGENISTSLTRLLTKLSSHASSGTDRIRNQADTALRDNVEELINGWDLQDPNPDDYTLILDSMSKATPLFSFDELGEDDTPLTGAHRLCQMAMEVDSWGTTVEKAVLDLLERGEVSDLFKMADQAPEGSSAAERLTAFIASPAQLRRLLKGIDVDESTLKAVVGRMGNAAAPVLLDALTESESRAVRRKVFDTLVEMGAGAGPEIMKRLEDPRWFVSRNLLALIQRLPEPPEGFSAAPFIQNPDPRVRREALPLAMKEAGLKKRALALGLAESDQRLVRMALLAVQEEIPEPLVPVLVNRVVRSNHPRELRAMGVRTLRHSRSSLALEALLDVASTGKSLLGRTKLAPAAPHVLAALQVLSGVWREDPRTRDVIDLAEKSRDPEIRKAVAEGRGGK